MEAYGCYLMKKDGDTYTKLIDIVDMPDIGEDNDELEITTLSDYQHRFMPGIKGSGSMDFTVNYEYSTFKAITALERQELDLAIWMGFSGDSGNEVPDGSDGKWSFSGYVSIRKNGQGVGDAPQATVKVTPSSVIKFE